MDTFAINVLKENGVNAILFEMLIATYDIPRIGEEFPSQFLSPITPSLPQDMITPITEAKEGIATPLIGLTPLRDIS